MWTTESTGRLAELSAAVAAQDRAAVARIAHALLGSSSAVGAVDVEQVCRELDESLRSGDHLDLGGAQERLERAVVDAVRELGLLGAALPGPSPALS
jgi:HPt (histidine-containing phosphotransfer) domain-containing protein